MATLIHLVLATAVLSRIGLGATVTVIIRQQDHLPCPEEIRCLSLTECLANSETCLTSNTTLLFDPGDHYTDGIETLVVVEDVTNLTLTRGVSDTIPLVRIYCTTRVGFVFENVAKLTIVGISFNHCGTTIPEQYYFYRRPLILDGTQAALFLTDVSNFTALHLEVTHSHGMGLLGWNVVGYSVISYSSFTYNNYNTLSHHQRNPWYCRIDAIYDNASTCIGGNAAFIFSAGCTTLTITHTEFKFGVNMDYSGWMDYYPDDYFYPAGGLTVFIRELSCDLEVQIMNVSSDSNTGYAGANMVIYVNDYINKIDTQIVIENSSIKNGNTEVELFSGTAFSGGLYFGFGSMNYRRASACAQNLHPPCNMVNMTVHKCNFSNNYALHGAAMYALSKIVYDRCLYAQFNVLKTRFLSNTGISGIVFAQEEGDWTAISVLDILLSRNIFENNVILYKSQVNLNENFQGILKLENFNAEPRYEAKIDSCTFQDNSATAIHVSRTTVVLLGQVVLQRNTGVHGGGISIGKEGQFVLGYVCISPDAVNSFHLIIQDNTAVYGGGIFYEDTCKFCSHYTCFFYLDEGFYDKARVTLAGNTALAAGNSLYGGNIDKCWVKQCGILDSIHDNTIFHEVFNYPDNASDLAEISSDPQQVCFCELQKPVCGLMVKSVSVYPGALFSVDAVGVGQMNGTVPTVVVAEVKDGYSGMLGAQQEAQPLGTVCGELSYHLNTIMNYTELEIGINFDRNPFSTLTKHIAVTLLGCPLGFRVNPLVQQCDCIEFLSKRGISCDIDTPGIQWQSPLWVGYSHSKFIVHDNCPFDYCKEGIISASFPDTNTQCEFSRSGILCGQCQPGFSSVFATSQCKKCSNKYLSLLIPIALAGFLLAALLIYCDLTVAKGTLNGLIFYANIVRVNHNIIFPAGETNVLTVFIAWLNLDLGIETCFYNGMDEYGRTWLQFIFPVYVWVIVGIIIVACRYSSLAVRITGSNAVAVLATLFLLSYTKIQRTILTVLSLTVISSHDGGSSVVWLYDGNVPYTNGKHAALFVMAICVAVAFILPFTVLVLFGPLLQSKCSHRLMKLKLTPILDAYQGPYKDRFRCWTGVMLLVRILLLLVFSANALGNPRLNLLVIVTTMLILLGFTYSAGAVYKELWINVLDSFYIINLTLLAAWTEFNRQGDSGFRTKQAATSYTLVGVAFVGFLCILLYHAVTQLRRFMVYHSVRLPLLRARDGQVTTVDNEQLEPVVSPGVPTTTWVDIRARESLLGSYATT